ncbi:host attachment protein [Sediminicoccus sp. BL-A-41-H5]|uniref:host attachment protein n=1 Tax=Sediminicoccus sp. BL-A-41-H5 TaxID=3421106 RepID=UPI003D679A97
MVPRTVTVFRCRPTINAPMQGDKPMPNAVEWALVADARHVRLLERHGGAAWAERPDTISAPDNPASHEHGTERPGRVHESVGSARHAIEPRQDPHRAAEASFARHVADELEKGAAMGRYDSLVLLAPPVFLGDLRKALGAATRQRLRSSLAKDIAQASLAVIIRQLDEVRPA